ncbi:MAG: hypothetical protein JST90_14680 [Bacteroidetes bacterium]|nr:hypothetical protein [Bacteroidota bacterium]
MFQTSKQKGTGPKTAEEQHQALREKAREMGKNLAVTLLPSAGKDESMELYIKSIRGPYSSLLGQEMGRIPSNHADIAEIEGRSAEQKSVNLNERLSECRARLRREQLELTEMDQDDARHKTVWPWWGAAFLVALVESMFSYKSFTMLDLGNHITLALLMVSLTVAFTLLPKALRWWYEDYTPAMSLRWFLNAIPVLAIGAGFYVLGLLRAKLLASQAALSIEDGLGPLQGITVSPWYFMGINAFLLVIGYFIAHQFPTAAQSKNKYALEKKESAIAKLETQIERWEAELSAIPEREKNSLIRSAQNTAGRREAYEKVNSFFKEAVGAFIEANITYRSDGQRPRCFDAPVADLEMKIS